MIKIVIIAILFALPLVHSYAQKAGERRMNRPGSPCFEDREKFCKNIVRGQGRIRDCLKENEERLSPACKEFLEKNLPKKS